MGSGVAQRGAGGEMCGVVQERVRLRARAFDLSIALGAQAYGAVVNARTSGCGKCAGGVTTTQVEMAGVLSDRGKLVGIVNQDWVWGAHLATKGAVSAPGGRRLTVLPTARFEQGASTRGGVVSARRGGFWRTFFRPMHEVRSPQPLVFLRRGAPRSRQIERWWGGGRGFVRSFSLGSPLSLTHPRRCQCHT